MAEAKEPIRLTNPLQTIKDNNVNQIGSTAIGYLKNYPLERGKTIKFRLLRKKVNPDPQKREGAFLYPNISLRTQYWINDKENGPVEVAAIHSINRDNSFRIKKYSVDGSNNQGIFTLYGDNVEDQKIFPYLMLSPENRYSPFYNTGEEALYEIIDEIGEAKKSVNRVGVLLKCLQAISHMELEELRLYNTAFGGSTYDAKEVMMNRLNELATKDPIDFFKVVDEPIIKIKALIKQATELNVIQYEAQQHKYLWVVSQETIATLDRIAGNEPIDLFAEWLHTSKDGEKIQKMILLKMKDK